MIKCGTLVRHNLQFKEHLTIAVILPWMEEQSHSVSGLQLAVFILYDPCDLTLNSLPDTSSLSSPPSLS